MRFNTSLVWFRRDLRHTDHAALYHALQQSHQVYCVFIFDRTILDPLQKQNPQDRRVEFILASIKELSHHLQNIGGDLIVRHAHAETEIIKLVNELNIDAVFSNRDYEPNAIKRDSSIAQQLSAINRSFIQYKDHIIFEKDEVLTQANTHFSVFTPYKNAWLKKLHAPGGEDFINPYTIDANLTKKFARITKQSTIDLNDLGFLPTNLTTLNIPTGSSGANKLLNDFLLRIDKYDYARDFPAIKGPSYLSTHFRFGTISIRQAVRAAINATHSSAQKNGASVWLSELIWRDFYSMILAQHPHVTNKAFKPAYDKIIWEQDKQAADNFKRWCQGETGYPLVDAAMLQLNQTGYMHNRLRMVTACFLIKDLGIDWRLGEDYFATHLLDFDLASNNGGWQWAASTGCDAQPYFRIFNPITQSQKFDPDGKFIRRYLPKLAALNNKHIHAPWLADQTQLTQANIILGKNYPYPIVEHSQARLLTLARYGVVK